MPALELEDALKFVVARVPVLAALTLLGGSTPGVVSAPSMAAWA